MEGTMTNVSPMFSALNEEMVKTALQEINCELGLNLEDLTEIENAERFAELMLSGESAVDAYKRTQRRFGADDATDERPTDETNARWIYVGMADCSMEPKLQIGDVLFVRKQSTVNNGDVAVVRIDGEALLTRQVFYKRDFVILSPLNPAYDPLILSKEERDRACVIGRVMRLARPIDHSIFEKEWKGRLYALTSEEGQA